MPSPEAPPEPADAGVLAAAFDAGEFYVPPAEVIATELRRPEYGHFNVIHFGDRAQKPIFIRSAWIHCIGGPWRAVKPS